jgi:hypothetical protein
VDVLEKIVGGCSADGDTDTGGERREYMRGALEQGRGSGYADEAGVDLVAHGA